jgi:hypothetical protein
MMRGLDQHIQGGVFADGLEDEDEVDTETCPICDSESIEPSSYLDDKQECNDCGSTFDPVNGEEVMEWSFTVAGDLSDMTRSEAKAYIEEMLDHIERATGYCLQFDTLN